MALQNKDYMEPYRDAQDAGTVAQADALISSGTIGYVAKGVDLLVGYLERLRKNYIRIHSDDGMFGVNYSNWRVFEETKLLMKAADRLAEHDEYLELAARAYYIVLHHGNPSEQDYLKCFTHLVGMGSRRPRINDRVDDLLCISNVIVSNIGYPLQGELADTAKALNGKAIEEFAKNAEMHPCEWQRKEWYDRAARYDKESAEFRGRDRNPRMTEVGRVGLKRISALREKPLSSSLANVLSKEEAFAFLIKEDEKMFASYAARVEKVENYLTVPGLPLESLVEVYACIDNALTAPKGSTKEQHAARDYAKAVKQFQNPLDRVGIHLFTINHLASVSSNRVGLVPFAHNIKNDRENGTLGRIATAELFRDVELLPIEKRIEIYSAVAQERTTHDPYYRRGEKRGWTFSVLAKLSMRRALRDLDSLPNPCDRVSGIFQLAKLANANMRPARAERLANGFVQTVEALPDVPARLDWYKTASQVSGYLIAFGSELRNVLRPIAQAKLQQYGHAPTCR